MCEHYAPHKVFASYLLASAVPVRIRVRFKRIRLDQRGLDIEIAALYKPEQILDEQVHLGLRGTRVGKVQIVDIFRAGHRSNGWLGCGWSGGVAGWIAFDVDHGKILGFFQGSRCRCLWLGGRVFRFVDGPEAVDNLEAIFLGVLTVRTSISGGHIRWRPHSISHINRFGFAQLFNVTSNVFLREQTHNYYYLYYSYSGY